MIRPVQISDREAVPGFATIFAAGDDKVVFWKALGDSIDATID